VEGSSRGFFQGTAYIHLEGLWKTMIEYEKTVGVPAEIRTRNLLHMKQKHYHLSQLACFHLLVKTLFYGTENIRIKKCQMVR
jgi:hypothetical protein